MFVFVYGNNVFVGLLVRGKSGLTCVYTHVTGSCICVFYKCTARFISVFSLIFLPTIVFASGRCLTRKLRVSR